MNTITKKQRILHVDDEPDTLASVKIILEHEGYEVVSVNRGDKALKEININGYNLIILDIMMPDMSGWELFSKIGEIKPGYKVIFLSVLDLSPDKIKELFDAGVKDYINKSFDRADFLARIKKVIDE